MESMSESGPIDRIEHGAVRELRMNRPPVNAMTRDFLEAIKAAMDDAQREGARAIVLSGLAGRFSAGLDLPVMLRLGREEIAGTWRALYEVFRTIAASPIPVVAAITGHAIAGGMMPPIFCDWRVAAEGDYKIGLNATQVGIPLPPVILAGLRRLVGPRRAEYLAVMGALLPPQEALQFRLVDEIADAGSVIERAVAWGQCFANLPEAASVTRNVARADIVAFFEDRRLAEDSFTEPWFSPSTQKHVRAAAERLGKAKALQ